MKKKKLLFLLKIFIFFIITAIVLSFINTILAPKWRIRSYHNAYTTLGGFYKLDRDSVDVLMVGTSHCFFSFSPQELYDNYSIRSYNLGTSGQNLVDTYYLLEEAFKYQSPKAVVLETLYFYEDIADEYSEGAHRKAISKMRFSDVKRRAIDSICDITTSLDRWTFYFQNLRFHSRWNILTMEDFISSDLKKHTQAKGYLPAKGRSEDTTFIPFDENESTEKTEIQSYNVEYFNKIVDLCNENNAEILLIKVPAKYWTISDHNTVSSLASERGISFYDLNESSLFCELDNYDYSMDVLDEHGHANVVGACKLSSYLGKILTEDKGITGVRDEQWESTREFCSDSKKTCTLEYIDDASSYFNSICDDRYTIFLVSGEKVSPTEINSVCEKLGLSEPEDYSNDDSGYYYGIIRKGNVLINKLTNENESLYGSFGHGLLSYEITAGSTDLTEHGEIKLIDVEGILDVCKHAKGLNIVVYDEDFGGIVDSSYYEFYDPEYIYR